MRGHARGLIVIGAAVLACFGVTVVAQARESDCWEVSVSLSGLTGMAVPGVMEPPAMRGVYCRALGHSEHTVQVLVPGATYNHTYWDFPYRPDTYNFRLAMNRAGFDTLTVDRLGTGASSRPPSALLTAASQASAVHQVIQALRQGRLGAERGDKVIIGGHSLGSAITSFEASTYHDVDGVLLTGISHRLNDVNAGKFFSTAVHPAALDPAFSRRGYDPGYLTTNPGGRAEYFYAPGTAEPGVARTDEHTKDVFASTEAADGILTISSPQSRAIDVPVLLVDASGDKLMCGMGTDCANAATLKASEGSYYSPAARLRTFVLPGFGHDVNLAPNTPDYQRAVTDWATEIAK
jgi:pimeloyl-ACP methyl ester carboxylesterase